MASASDLTFVIPTHNRTDLLEATLRSVFRQTVMPTEIILADNGTEGRAAATVSAMDLPVTIVKSEPNAKQVARNTGIRAAETAWVATLDDDDLLHPRYVEEVQSVIVGGEADIISTDHRKFTGERFDTRTNFEMAPPGYWDFWPDYGQDEAVFLGKFPLPNLLRRVPIYPSTTVIRRDFALKIGGYDPRMKGILSEDLEFLIRSLTYGTVGLINKPLVDYRIHPGNDTRSKTGSEIGRWRIFEWSRKNHPDLPVDFIAALNEDLPARRAHIFDLAYRRGDAELMSEVAPLLRPEDWTAKRRLRRTMARAPHSIKSRTGFGALTG